MPLVQWVVPSSLSVPSFESLLHQHMVTGSGGLTMGPMWHVAAGAPGPSGHRAKAYFFRHRGIVEMVSFVAFPRAIGRTTPSNQATLLYKKGAV